MYTLDLKLALFVLLLFTGLVSGTTVALVQRRARRQRTTAAVDALHPLLVNAPLAVVVFDQALNIHYINPMAERLLAISPTVSALPERNWTAHLRADLQAVQRADRQAGCYRVEQLAGAQPMTVRWWVTRWHDWALLFVTDITAQQQAEQAAQVLLSDLAHELRTPLATLLTHLEVLRLPSLSEEMSDQSLAFMKAEVQRLVRLSNNLVELGRLQATATLAIQTIDLVTLVESVIAQVRLRAEERQMALKLVVAGAHTAVLGDPDRLRQLFLNLIDNAVKYGGAGNQITIQLTAQPQGLACAVCDTGPGIPAAHLPHLTRRFYRAAPAGVSGSGLGLAMVAEILRQHQSQLTIESHTADEPTGQQSGTCIRFTLPAALPVLSEQQGKVTS